MQPAIGALIAELGLAAFCQSGDGDVNFERMSREAPQRHRSIAQEQQSMRLVGGTAALVHALANELPVQQILLTTRVTAMALAVWREAGLSGTAQSMVGPMVEMHDATTASGNAALFGFLGVAAEQRAALGEETLARACLNQFTRIFGSQASHPRATLFKDWAADPLTATAADRAAAGHIMPGDEPWVAAPWAAHLSLAGSETSVLDPGYLAGAVVAADRAVTETLARLSI